MLDIKCTQVLYRNIPKTRSQFYSRPCHDGVVTVGCVPCSQRIQPALERTVLKLDHINTKALLTHPRSKFRDGRTCWIVAAKHGSLVEIPPELCLQDEQALGKHGRRQWGWGCKNNRQQEVATFTRQFLRLAP